MKEAKAPQTVLQQPMAAENKTRNWLIFASVGTFAAIVFGVLYLFVIAPAIPGSNAGWFLFSFATGLTMIVLPCTLPLAFVIVPLSMGKGMVRGLGMALAFGIGVATTLSLYGVIAALLGGVAIDALGADLEVVKNWVYFVAGTFALVFALSEIGLMNVHMPTYSGAAPAFIQKRGELIKAFLLGLFLGNVGIGCPHPATPLILIEIASSGDVLYGWLMFLTHAIGRILPLLLLAFLAILGVNGLNWLMARKDKVEKTTGWAMVFVAGFILTLGLFSHDWWVNSGLHSGLETLTQEQRFNVLINDTLGTTVEHVHGLEVGEGLFGLPLEWGNWFLVLVWLIPIWWWYIRKRKRVTRAGNDPHDDRLLDVTRNFLIVISIFIVLVFTYFLPQNFYLRSIGDAGHDDEHSDMVDDGHTHSGEEEPDHHSDEMDMGEAVNGTAFSKSTASLAEATGPVFVELNNGDSYDIVASYVKKEVGNRTLRMMAYNGSIPGPFIKVKEGAQVTINFTNDTDIDQTIHSHGLRLDNNFDGVPGVTQDAVKPGETFTYTISFPDAGAAWYHPHTRDDYGQELGLYGNYLIDSGDTGYWRYADREVPLVVDDILIENDEIEDFYKEFTTHALLGRFGNEFLVNGVTDYKLQVAEGELIRFVVTNVSNARIYDLSIPGAQMRIAGAEWGRFEKVGVTESALISPAERLYIEVLFNEPGTFNLEHTIPGNEPVVLARFNVAKDGTGATPDLLLQNYINEDVVSEMQTLRDEYLLREPDKRMLLTVSIEGKVDHTAHMHSDAPAEIDESMPHDHTAAGESVALGHDDDEHESVATGPDAIQWDDPTNSDLINTTDNIIWKLIDQATGRESMDIPIEDWTFREGDMVKVRITNDSEADHVMQHPMHLHGQRFVVLSENGVQNENMAWKDTALILPGEYMDILVDMSNPGVWMAHCHISEHLHAGMMLGFRVEDQNGYAPGDEYREALYPDQVAMNSDVPQPLQYNFSDAVEDTEYYVTPDTKFADAGKDGIVTLTFTDSEGNIMNLGENLSRPLTVTFVNSDNTVRFVTYPGNTSFPAIEEYNIPGSGNFDESLPHMHDTSDGHSMRLISIAHAHGGVEDGHVVEEGRTYSVPVRFPTKGVYRGFVEFTLAGENTPRISSFDMEVGTGFSINNYGWSATITWWVLLIGSILLMLPLVWVVRKYINS